MATHRSQLPYLIDLQPGYGPPGAIVADPRSIVIMAAAAYASATMCNRLFIKATAPHPLRASLENWPTDSVLFPPKGRPSVQAETRHAS